MAGSYIDRGDGLLDITDESGNTFAAPMDPAVLQARGFVDASAQPPPAGPPSLDIDQDLYSAAEAPDQGPDERTAFNMFGPQVQNVTPGASPFGGAVSARDAAMVQTLPFSGSAQSPQPQTLEQRADAPPARMVPTSAPAQAPAPDRVRVRPGGGGEATSQAGPGQDRVARSAIARRELELQRSTGPTWSRTIKGGPKTRGWQERDGVLDPAEAEEMALEAEGTAAERQNAYDRAEEEQAKASQARQAAYDAQLARFEDERIEREGTIAEVENDVDERTALIEKMVEETPRVDQGRWWADQSMPAKWVMIAGIIGNTIQGKRDVVQMIDRQVERDINQQEKAIANQQQGVETQRGLLRDFMQQHGSPQQAKMQLRMLGLEQAKAELARAESVAQDAGKRAALADARAQVDGELANEKLKLKQLAHKERTTSVEVVDDRVVSGGGRRGLSPEAARRRAELEFRATTGNVPPSDKPGSGDAVFKPENSLNYGGKNYTFTDKGTRDKYRTQRDAVAKLRVVQKNVKDITEGKGKYAKYTAAQKNAAIKQNIGVARGLYFTALKGRTDAPGAEEVRENEAAVPAPTVPQTTYGAASKWVNDFMRGSDSNEVALKALEGMSDDADKTFRATLKAEAGVSNRDKLGRDTGVPSSWKRK